MGLILYQMYTGRELFEELSLAEAAVAFMTRSLPPIDHIEGLPEDLADILRDCWIPNAESRPSFSMIYDRIRLLECPRRIAAAVSFASPSNPSSASSSSSASSTEPEAGGGTPTLRRKSTFRKAFSRPSSIDSI